MLKRILSIGLMLTIMLSICSCDEEDTNSSSVDYETLFDSASQLATYIIDNRYTNEKAISFCNKDAQTKLENGINIYEPGILPEKYYLEKISLSGSYFYYTYYTEELKIAKDNNSATKEMETENTISFTWAFEFDGHEALQNRIDKEGLTELSNMKSYYYAYSSEQSCIYWCEDNYRFSLCIPSSVGTVNTTTHEYSGEDVFTLQKTFYPFDDNTVAE